MAVILDGATGVDITAGSLIYPDDTSRTTAASGMQVIASGADTTNTVVSEIEVTGLETYNFIQGFFMCSTRTASDTLQLDFAIDSGSYVTLSISDGSTGGTDTFSSYFTMQPKPANGYVAGIGNAFESANTWDTTSGELHELAGPQGYVSQFSYPATTGITSIRWRENTGGNINYWRYVVLGSKD